MPRRAPLHRLLRSAPVLFLLAAAAAASLFAALFARLTFSPARPAPLGCRPDGEGSWSIGVFYGDSPLSLRPIEDTLVSSNGTKAWPLANPVFTCAAPSQAGYPSNFVADPFLYIQGVLPLACQAYHERSSFILACDRLCRELQKEQVLKYLHLILMILQSTTLRHLMPTLQKEQVLKYP